MKTVLLSLVLVAGTISGLSSASADSDYREIRGLVERGEILSLEEILSRYPESDYGRLLDLEVDAEHGQIVYEMEFLRDDGRVLELEVDARDGELLEQEIE